MYIYIYMYIYIQYTNYDFHVVLVEGAVEIAIFEVARVLLNTISHKECYDVSTGKHFPTFRDILLSPSSGYDSRNLL